MVREIKRIGVKTSAMGMGCWAIGSEWTLMGDPVCYGKTDDRESVMAIEAAYESGIRLFDTAANYGAGLSEKLIAKALGNRINDCFISTKFGFNVNETTKNVVPYGLNMKTSDVLTHIRIDVEKSLKRLKKDYIDALFFHIWDYDRDLSIEIRDKLQDLVQEGKIRCFGWSIDDPELIKLWGEKEGSAVTQAEVNIVRDSPEVVDLCEKKSISILNRSPLAMGFLTGKYSKTSVFGKTDARSGNWVKEQFQKPALNAIESVREILTSGGRTPAQGSIAWLWARSENNFPIPGIRTVNQAIENAGAMEFGPLKQSEYLEVEKILGRN